MFNCHMQPKPDSKIFRVEYMVVRDNKIVAGKKLVSEGFNTGDHIYKKKFKYSTFVISEIL